jgi:hypothetical protein
MRRGRQPPIPGDRCHRSRGAPWIGLREARPGGVADIAEGPSVLKLQQLVQEKGGRLGGGARRGCPRASLQLSWGRPPGADSGRRAPASRRAGGVPPTAVGRCPRPATVQQRGTGLGRRAPVHKGKGGGPLTAEGPYPCPAPESHPLCLTMCRRRLARRVPTEALPEQWASGSALHCGPLDDSDGPEAWLSA